MDWVAFVIQWLHVLLGMLWFINALLVATVLIPTLNTFPLPIQREVGGRYGERTVRIFNVVIPVVIVLGFVRGTVFGPIKSIEAAFTTAYGVTWLVALVVAIAIYLWSMLVIERGIAAMNAIPLKADGGAPPELEHAVSRLKGAIVLELMGFLVIFTCMILMRFGL
jgi:hypothetical protein